MALLLCVQALSAAGVSFKQLFGSHEEYTHDEKNACAYDCSNSEWDEYCVSASNEAERKQDNSDGENHST
jgi:hypothetical protein